MYTSTGVHHIENLGQIINDIIKWNEHAPIDVAIIVFCLLVLIFAPKITKYIRTKINDENRTKFIVFLISFVIAGLFLLWTINR